MYHILPKSKDNVIGICVEGQMRTEDYETLLPFVANMIRAHGTVRVLADLRNLTSIEFRGILKTFPFAFKYSSHVEKKAVITDKKWIYNWTRLLAPFFKTEVRCFPSRHIDKAWTWVQR